jgi:carbon-monoxide dehydrogenase medium subunit
MMEYHRAHTIEDAAVALEAEGAMALAGGTDLVLLEAAGVLAPSRLVDIKGIPVLRHIVRDTDATRIGATTTMTQIAGLRGKGCDALADAAGIVGGLQTRVRATLGGNICRSSPAGDTLPPLLALGARATLTSSTASRSVLLEDFFTAPGENVRRAQELLVAVELPVREGGSAYQRLTYRRAMDLAVVGVAVRLNIEDGVCVDACVAAGAVGPTPLISRDAASVLVGSEVDDRTVARAADALVEGADPIDDVRGSRKYRLRALRVITRRTVTEARQRATRKLA